MHRIAAVSWLIAVLLPGPTPALLAQAGPPACADSLARSMAFLQGDWQGNSYSLSGRDTVLDALMEVHSEPLFGRCALEERWTAVKDGRQLFAARVLRAYDAATQRWSVFYVDDQLNAQVYEGRREAGQWRFFRSRMDKGTPIQVRLTWRQAGSGYDQLIERSRDGGATWTVGGYVTFQPTAGSR